MRIIVGFDELKKGKTRGRSEMEERIRKRERTRVKEKQGCENIFIACASFD